MKTPTLNATAMAVVVKYTFSFRFDSERSATLDAPLHNSEREDVPYAALAWVVHAPMKLYGLSASIRLLTESKLIRRPFHGRRVGGHSV